MSRNGQEYCHLDHKPFFLSSGEKPVCPTCGCILQGINNIGETIWINPKKLISQTNSNNPLPPLKIESK